MLLSQALLRLSPALDRRRLAVPLTPQEATPVLFDAVLVVTATVASVAALFEPSPVVKVPSSASPCSLSNCKQYICGLTKSTPKRVGTRSLRLRNFGSTCHSPASATMAAMDRTAAHACAMLSRACDKGPLVHLSSNHQTPLSFPTSAKQSTENFPLPFLVRTNVYWMKSKNAQCLSFRTRITAVRMHASSLF